MLIKVQRPFRKEVPCKLMTGEAPRPATWRDMRWSGPLCEGGQLKQSGRRLATSVEHQREELRDAANILRVTAGMIHGLKKTINTMVALFRKGY